MTAIATLPPIACFFVPGVAIPWRPPRIVRDGRHSFTPAHVRRWQGVVRERAVAAMGGKAPHAGPVELGLVFTRKAPKARREDVWWAQRPDLLNLAKAVEDALNGVVYADDNQVVSHRFLKRRGEREGVAVRVMAL